MADPNDAEIELVATAMLMAEHDYHCHRDRVGLDKIVGGKSVADKFRRQARAAIIATRALDSERLAKGRGG